MKTIPGTTIPLCLICEDDPATTKVSGIGPVCPDCKHHAIVAQQACLHAWIGPEVIASRDRNNKPRRAPRRSK